jgi:hypothetical protein
VGEDVSELKEASVRIIVEEGEDREEEEGLGRGSTVLSLFQRG